MKISDIVMDGPVYIYISPEDPDAEEDMGEGITFYYKDDEVVGIGFNRPITVTGYLREVSD